jgi:hypothetical protein
VYRLGYNDTKREEENKVDFSTTYALFDANAWSRFKKDLNRENSDDG